MNETTRLKVFGLKKYIRQRLIRTGQYTEKRVEEIFNKVTDNGRDLSEVEVLYDQEKVAKLHTILSGLIDN